MNPLSSPQTIPGAEYPTGHSESPAVGVSPCAPQHKVGADRHAHLSLAELEQYIGVCEGLWRAAYERFQQHGNPPDREEAVLWLHAQNEAILERSRRVGAARHAEFEQRYSEGNDYFQSAHALALGRQLRGAA